MRLSFEDAAQPRRLLALFSAIVAACLVFFVIWTWHWPLVGDAVLVDYAVFLLEHGMAPYRQIVDVQMPGTYLVDWLVLHVFGTGAIGLRLFDFTLLATVICAMQVIAWRPKGKFAGGGGSVSLLFWPADCSPCCTAAMVYRRRPSVT